MLLNTNSASSITRSKQKGLVQTMTKIKICGLRRMEDINYVNQCKPDYVGFVFADSPRKVTKEQARQLRNHLEPDIIPVGVFVNEEVEVVAELINEGIIDIAQLHGEEDEVYIHKLRKLTDNGLIIKAVRVASEEDVTDCEQIPADYLLFDSFSIQKHGGTGKVFDWSLIQQVRKPFFLAGGIRMDNVQKAISEVRPFAVDVSSAVETGGYKDYHKIKQILLKVKMFNGNSVCYNFIGCAEMPDFT